VNLSVIVPVHNGGESFERCLDALSVSIRSMDKIIIVDDASTDASAAKARAAGMQVISIQGQPRGPAVARNRGAKEAHGDILVFLDADVAVHKDTLACIEGYFIDNPELAAVFGSYDDNPPERSIVSLYKNLQHHYVHQHGNQLSSTFWAGCGAIRRNIFESIGGFSEKYTRPSIEDIELGRGLNHEGYRVWLCPDIQVSHLKIWTFTRWLKSDIFDRAIPWSRLILQEGTLNNDLNINWQNRLSAVVAWAFVLCFIMGFFLPLLWIVACLCMVTIVTINRDMYRFFTHKGGFFFAIASVFFHFLYFLYSSATFAIMAARYKLLRFWCQSHLV
jgi:GT2 family glycosyltransferase